VTFIHAHKIILPSIVLLVSSVSRSNGLWDLTGLQEVLNLEPARQIYGWFGDGRNLWLASEVGAILGSTLALTRGVCANPRWLVSEWNRIVGQLVGIREKVSGLFLSFWCCQHSLGVLGLIDTSLQSLPLFPRLSLSMSRLYL